jgi:hypothetical protein
VGTDCGAGIVVIRHDVRESQAEKGSSTCSAAVWPRGIQIALFRTESVRGQPEPESGLHGARKVRMSNERTSDGPEQPESYWDEGIRALIRGTLHHDLDGTSLHEHRPEEPQIVDPARRPRGGRGRRRRARVNVPPRKRKRRKAS